MNEPNALAISGTDIIIGADGCLYRNGTPIINPAEQLTPDDLQRVEQFLQNAPAARQKMVDWQESNVDEATKALDLQREAQEKEEAARREKEKQEQEANQQPNPLAALLTDAALALAPVAMMLRRDGSDNLDNPDLHIPGEALRQSAQAHDKDFGKMSDAAKAASRKGESGNKAG
ncbi:MAG: hypothetical protein J0L97_05865 [Alphaproteobacteria bacterium]|nr:hypothetical protein [Alphaproteobacteria bacterium]